jgi:type I restriction enzyme S subunit
VKLKTVSFGSVCHLVNGKAFKASDWSTSGVPIIRIQNLNGSDKPFNYWAGSVGDQVQVKRGDLLLAWSGTPGTSFGAHIWQGQDSILNQHIFRCDIDTDVITPEWAKFAVNIQLSQLIGLAHGGVGLKHVTRGVVQNLRLPLPALSEQRRTTKILDRAEALRAKRRAALTQLDTLTQSIFLDLFGEPGANPKGWPLRLLSEYVAEFQGGKSIEAESGNGVITRHRVLKVSSVTAMKFLSEESKPVPDNYYPPAEHFVRVGDLLFSRANTTDLVGAVAFVDSVPLNVLLPDKIWRFVWREPVVVDPLFIWVLFQMPAIRREIQRRATGTSGSMKNISQQKLLGISTVLPPLPLQRQFAKCLIGVEKLKVVQQRCLAELDALFATLQDRAFRGAL